MNWLEYDRYFRLYLSAQRQYDAILTEKSELFAQTQPQAVNTEKIRVIGGVTGNPYDNYVIAKEERRIDERLSEAESILYGREELLRQKEKDLRASKDIRDKIYCMRMIDRAQIRVICRETHYSRSQIFRILDGMREKMREV